MRLAYNTVAAAAILSVLVAAAVFSGHEGPSTVAAALRLEDPDAAKLDQRRAEAVAALTATCMHAQGLPYVPIAEPPPAVPDGGLDPVAWAARWGFGVSTAIDAPPPPPVQDPNAVYATTLAADPRRAYDKALHGTTGRDGCASGATRQVMGVRARAMEPLRGELEVLEAAIDDDPAMTTIAATWASCVSSLGVPSPDRATLSIRIIERFGNELRALHERADLARLQADERRVATQAARCDAAFVAARASVAAPYERGFVERHRAELDRIGASIRSTEAAWPTIPP